MSMKRKLSAFPQVYSAILDHFREGTEDIMVDGLSRREATHLVNEWRKFCDLLGKEKTPQTEELYNVSREVDLRFSPNNVDGDSPVRITFRLNQLAYAFRKAGEVKKKQEPEEKKEEKQKEGADSVGWDIDELKRMIREGDEK